MSSDSIQPFDFEGCEVRFVGTADVPEWVAADVVAILYPEADRSSYSKYSEKLPSEWKGKKPVLTPGGSQMMATLLEPGLYALISRSNSPKAVPFQRWVFEEVLPSIRKTGSYAIPSASNPSLSALGVKDKLESIRLGMDLMYELGGLDERTQLALKDIVRDVLLEPKLKHSSLPVSGRAEWPVSDRARHLGYRPNRKELMRIGRATAKLYRLRHSYVDEDGNAVKVDPPEREQYVDGTTRLIKCYGEDDLDILDQSIRMVMEPPAEIESGD